MVCVARITVVVGSLLVWGVVALPGAEARCCRSAAVYRQFLRSTGYPQGRPGYVVDHVIPLACGGPDTVSNMQWQSVAEAKQKDRVERTGCPGCKGVRR